MPQKAWSAGEEMAAAQLQQYLQNQVVATFATSAARASEWPAPPVGAVSALDTNKGTLWTWTGTQWARADWWSAWGLAGPPGQRTSANVAVGALTAIGGCSVAFTSPGGRRYEIKSVAVSQQNASTTGVHNVHIQKGGADLAVYGATVLANCYYTGPAIGYDTPAAGPVTYSLAYDISGGGGTVFATTTQPATLSVVDVGPSGPIT